MVNAQPKPRKIGLVLSGGGIKAAAFHIGVGLALQEKGYRFAGGSKDYARRNFPDDHPRTIRLYVGSSAGSFVAAILSAGYSLEALIHAFQVGSGGQVPHRDIHSLSALKPIRYRDIFSVNGRGLFRSLPQALLGKAINPMELESFLKDRFKMNGLFTTQSLERYLRGYALSHNEFAQLGVELFVVGTQLNHTRKAIFGAFPESKKTSHLMWINHAKISEAVAASTSLPPVFAPYRIQDPAGKELHFFDGEIRDTLSTHLAADHGADLVFGSYSVQPYHYNEEIGSLHQFGIPVILNQALYQVIQQKIARNITYKKEIAQLYMSLDAWAQATGISDEHRYRMLEIIKRETGYKPEVKYVYIHPRPQDHEMFFADHFSLNAKTLEKIVRIGFKSGLQQLRNHEL